tara:strand:- start:103 stop:282 length:180 start_codon:yes stop_codon:yes gene_type:complete
LPLLVHRDEEPTDFFWYFWEKVLSTALNALETKNWLAQWHDSVKLGKNQTSDCNTGFGD